MEEEPVEVMAREFLPPEPTPEQRYEAYLRKRNASIIQKLAGMLKLDDLENIPRAVAQLQYFRSYLVDYQEKPPESKEELETDEEAIAWAEAREFRNKARKVEERVDEIRRKANWYPPSDEDEKDYADERKLEIYGSRVDEVESTVNLHAKGRQKQKLEKLVAVSLRPIAQVRVKDKKVQTSLQHTVLPKVRGQTEQVKFFAHMCKTLEANTPPYRSFWRSYYNKKL
jgi:adenylate kinase family enzyme